MKHLAVVIHFSSPEAGAISEGFGDYWAFSVAKAAAEAVFEERGIL